MVQRGTEDEAESDLMHRTQVVRGAALNYTPASHEPLSNPGCLKKVLAKKAALLAGQVQMINWCVIPPGKSFREHYHEDMQEVFVVLSGKATALSADKEIELGRGDAWIVNPRVKHAMRADSLEEVVYLVIGIAAGTGGRTVVSEASQGGEPLLKPE